MQGLSEPRRGQVFTEDALRALKGRVAGVLWRAFTAVWAVDAIGSLQSRHVADAVAAASLQTRLLAEALLNLCSPPVGLPVSCSTRWTFVAMLLA